MLRRTSNRADGIILTKWQIRTMENLTDEILKYAKKHYKTIPDHPWKRSPESMVLRHKDTRKWYALIMAVRREVLGIEGDGDIVIMNLKCDPVMSGSLQSNPGILPAYHMNHFEWISVLLDGTVGLNEVLNLLDLSFELTASKETKQKMRGTMDWLVPANPKYYDIVHAFDDSDSIDWKQSNDIHVGDNVFIYVTAPISAILYKTKAVEVKIPSREDYGLNVKWLMKLKLLRRYDPGDFTMDVVKEYGIYAVRGPRSMPDSLVEEMDK